MQIIKDKNVSAECFIEELFPSGSINKILLVNPPAADISLFQYDLAKAKRYSNYPPYGLGIIASNLLETGVQVKIVNLNNEVLKRAIESKTCNEFNFELSWKNKLDKAIASFNPDLIGVNCTFSMGYEAFRHVCQYAAKIGIPLAVGGVYVTNDIEKILEELPQVKLFFLGEADLAIKNFVRVVNKKLPVSELSQVVLNNKNDFIRFDNFVRPTSTDINVIPAYHLMDIAENSRYGTVGNFYFLKSENESFASMSSSRGCRGNCIFCSVRNFNGCGVRQRGISQLVDELELLVNRYGISHITWLDDDLFFNHKRAIEMFNAIAKRNLKITWDATNGVIASSCTDEVISACVDSGCIGLNIGVESGNPQILKEIRKPNLISNFFTAAKVLKKYEQVYACAFLMIGLKNESMSMIKDTINVALDMNLDWYRISIMEPLPNTPIYNLLKENDNKFQNDNREKRFMLGPYGKQREIEQGLRPALSPDYKRALSELSNVVYPDQTQLIDIWFYINYYLNFYRLFHEDRLSKIRHQIKHLRCICDQISLNHGFALYFLAYLENKFFQKLDADILSRLQKKLTESFYWSNRFEALGFNVGRILSPGWIPSDRDLKNHVMLFK